MTPSPRPTPPLYSIRTWDCRRQLFTPDDRLAEWAYLTRRQLVEAMRTLRKAGYTCHRRRDAYGGHFDNDPSVLIERMDDAR